MIEEQEVVADDTTQEYWEGDSNDVSEPAVELEPMDQAHLQEETPVEMPKSAEGSEEQRYQYWQSRYDQKASEFDNMSQKISEYEKVAPIAEYIKENPDILKTVAKSLSGDTPTVPSQEQSLELPQKPQRPTKPNNYDATESVMDADSDSYKYRTAMEDYSDGMFEYQDKRENVALQKLEMEKRNIAQQQQAYEAQQGTDNMKNQLVQQYGYTEEKAKDFVKFYSSPESITLENLVNLDKYRNSPSQQEVATHQKVQSMQNRSELSKVPTPAGIVSGKAQPQYSEEDLFNIGLMSNKR
tara:strand:- start:6654 stop:7547 length:894 start_codon:yes stop_codon:yes gene_type:complete